MAFFESDDGCRYHFEVVGEEADSGFPMFMLHGIIQSGAEWRRAGWVDALSGLRRLILVDLPGHGASDRPGDHAPYRVESIANAVLGISDVMGIERFDYMGFSLGGRVGYELAARQAQGDKEGHARALRALVITAQHARAPRDEPRLPRLIELFRSGKLRAMERGMGMRSEQAGATVNDPEAMVLAIEALRDWGGVEEALGGLFQPVMVISGEEDPAFRKAGDSAAAIPGVRWMALPGVDHNGTFYQVEASAAAVIDFLAFVDGNRVDGGETVSA
ncbi:MAG: alpha/beta fold hydrolase [Chloroflexi bacterium]|nr:alpha/beta fold hydrolase [Chloroflexota bacterium]